jgi:protein SCO1
MESGRERAEWPIIGDMLNRARIPAAIVLGLLGLVSLPPLLSGCKTPVPMASAAAVTKTFHIRGKVLATDPSGGQVSLDGEAVPGFMEAMIMPYKVVNPSILSELHSGDRITADVLADQISSDAEGGYRNVRLDHIVVIAQAKPDTKPTAQYHVPTAGDVVPNFALLNQSDKTIHLDDFKGRVVLMTFIYTRCPLADFCPRMSRNFATLDQQLATDPALYAKTHLISISFDPTYDTPKVLRSYGGAYTGQYTKERFLHWDFAAPPVKELPEMAQFFDVGVTPGDNNTLTHSLSTVVIGKDGKVVSWYPNNDWDPAQVLGTVKTAVAAS